MHTAALPLPKVKSAALSFDNTRALAWTCAVLPFVLLGLWRATQGTGFGADDYAQYLMHARAVLQGRSYSDIPYIASPYAPWVGPKIAPPGLPLLLIVMQLLGANFVVMKLVMLGLSTTFVVVSARYFARESDQRMGLGVALLVGLSPGLIQAAPQFLTDLPFAAVIWIMISLIDRADEFSWRKVAIVTLLGAYAVLLRPTGAVVGGALFVWAVLHYRSHGLKPFVPLVIWAAALLAISAVTEVGHAAVIRVSPLAVIQWVSREKLLLINLREYLNATAASHLYPFSSDRANDLLHAVTISLMVVGLTVWLRTARTRFATVFAACYFVMLLVMPLRQTRYIWPLYPIFVFGMLNGVRVSAAYLLRAPRRAGAVALGFSVLLAVPAIAQVSAAPAPRDLEDLPAVRQVFDYVRANSVRQHMRVTFFKPRTLAWATGVPTMGPLIGRPECLMRELRNKRITHVILGSLHSRGLGDLRQAVMRWPNHFTIELSNPRFIVYRFIPAGADLPNYPPCAPWK